MNNFLQNFISLVKSYEVVVYFWVVAIIAMFLIASITVLKLLDSKFSAKKTNIVIAFYLMFMSVVNCVSILYFFNRIEIFCQLTIVSFALFLLITAIYISKWSISKTVFGTLVGISIIAIIMETSMVSMFLVEGANKRLIAISVAFIIQSIFLIWFLQKVFKPHFIYTFRELPANWGWYAIVPIAQIIAHCLYFLYEIANSMAFDWRVCVNMTMVHVLMIFAYKLIFFNINKARDEERERMNIKIYESQVDMLSGQINASREAENSLKIMRHDLKHYIGTLKRFFDNGEIDKAKEYIGYVNTNVETLAMEFYCSNAIINACVGYYISRAREADIDISYKLNISNGATKNDMEFSTVVANALENAINACEKLAVEKRKIEITLQADKNKILLEVRNAFDGVVEFDDDHVPVSNGGIGVTSILAYAKVNVASVQFLDSAGTFVFRIIVDR